MLLFSSAAQMTIISDISSSNNIINNKIYASNRIQTKCKIIPNCYAWINIVVHWLLADSDTVVLCSQPEKNVAILIKILVGQVHETGAEIGAGSADSGVRSWKLGADLQSSEQTADTLGGGHGSMGQKKYNREKWKKLYVIRERQQKSSLHHILTPFVPYLHKNICCHMKNRYFFTFFSVPFWGCHLSCPVLNCSHLGSF